MQENYLFYEDLPAEDQLDFFMKPADFVKAAASSRDKKNGVTFSHADSIAPSRTQSEYPCFGLEVDYANTPQQGIPVMRVLYVQPNSPANQAGIKRGDWIIAVDSAKVSSANYIEQILQPTQTHEFSPPQPQNKSIAFNLFFIVFLCLSIIIRFFRIFWNCPCLPQFKCTLYPIFSTQYLHTSL